MIRVYWNGRLGNQLFEYALGRILAEELGYCLVSEPIPGFVRTYDNIYGKFIQNYIVLEGQKLDLESIRANKDKTGYIVNGWFQRYEYYKPHKEKIKQWFVTDINYPKNKNDLIIHIRRTQPGPIDHKIPHVVNGVTHMIGPDLLSVEWYKKVIDQISFNQLYICTDIPNDPFFDHFKEYRPIILSRNTLEDFSLIKSFNKIIMSQSTFSWWAAFLSDAEEIYMPRPNYGIWAHPDVSLMIDDESRVKIINAEQGTLI